MSTDIDYHRARIIEQIAQHHTHEETRHQTVNIAVGKREDEGCCNYRHMGIAKPAMQGLLQCPAEEKLLAYGRQKSNYHQLQGNVARRGERHHLLNQLRRGFGDATQLLLERAEIPADSRKTTAAMSPNIQDFPSALILWNETAPS